jgi:protein disulfide-isomerase
MNNFLKGDNLTYILIAVIVILAIAIICICKSKSGFGSHNETESTSVIMPSISTDSVIIFYAPWCGYCKRSMDEFKEAVSRGNGKIVLIDATHDDHKHLLKEYNVKGFPTIIKGDRTKYAGPRTAEALVEFLKTK